ncbi:NACHT domain-containing protein [Streptomyces sp. NPDC047014]|uniref:NACHT domain-containing protein n=1 Tax=Streptomyces sp. NPDC047014 TaxID=3155736 RepID=UPI0033D41C29
MEVLAGGRKALKGLAAELLTPLRLSGGTGRDLHEVFEGFPDRVRASHGTTRTALLCAADLVILVTAFCEAVAESGIAYASEIRPHQGNLATDIVIDLERVTLGSTRAGFPSRVRTDIEPAYSYAADLVHAEGNTHGTKPEDLARTAWRRYEILLDRVIWDCPELRLTSHTEDPPEITDTSPATRPTKTSLTALAQLFHQFAPTGIAADHHRRQLRAPIAASEHSGPRVPLLEAGYIDPAFRIADQTSGHTLSHDEWWGEQPLREDLAEFLAAYLLAEHATHHPLLILGHPGSGKSLLTKLIAARLPASEFFCHRVELRHLPADLHIQQQLEEALLRSTGRHTPWADVADANSGVVRVILIDGFDELLQAASDSAHREPHFDYLHRLQEFQQREHDQGRPTIALVTSRTVVADQTGIPQGTTVLRLEPFDDDRIDQWLTTWNATNRSYFHIRGLHPLSPDVMRPHRSLARQPLLLLMLALYDGAENALFHHQGKGVDRLSLYERLLAEFVRRQVAKHQAMQPAHSEAHQVERELQRLSVIAIGMFNRRKQSLTAQEAHDDLTQLQGPQDLQPTPLLFGRFFFIHEAQALHTGTELRSYEFLHATFGEYLLAHLITDELHHLLIAGTTDDGRLYAYLSHVPLSDRIEALDNIRELLAPLPPEHRSQLVHLLGRMIRTVRHGTPHRTDLPYRPTAPHGPQQEALYTANLLLLAAQADNRLRMSQLLGGDTPLDLWRRHTHLWRSQLSDSSWSALVSALSIHRPTEPADRDLSIRPPGTPAPLDPAWALNLTTPAETPGTVHSTEEQPLAARLHAEAAFTWEPDLQRLLHATAPLLHHLPNAFNIHRTHPDHRSTSAAHALINLM